MGHRPTQKRWKMESQEGKMAGVTWVSSTGMRGRALFLRFLLKRCRSAELDREAIKQETGKGDFKAVRSQIPPVKL